MNLQQQLAEYLGVLNPTHLEIINESVNHGGYYPGKESHFKVIIVSQVFHGMRAVQRHQKVYSSVHNLLAVDGGSIHALALHTYSENEWNGHVPKSPECAHAPKKLNKIRL
ncbi:BolA family protein [Acinetobacter nectaris]|uniref:BolA family protein n=1 Tax=Acinetobacter nectaris TaxID=1219382 RepID=UPI001F46011C|nr:BolA family protein [Acinetobacter nectaris]MCF8999880.1 BolA family transcriptional regulator [Acinetobacter nectaris]MCF9027363.1 BolA family transcriptional regulator [Acinetobacter nectaris]